MDIDYGSVLKIGANLKHIYISTEQLVTDRWSVEFSQFTIEQDFKVRLFSENISKSYSNKIVDKTMYGTVICSGCTRNAYGLNLSLLMIDQ